MSEQDGESGRWARSTKGRQIADRIREQMLRGPATGKMIPSERELAKRFGVARSTVRKAIEILSREGWLKDVPRQGHVIRTPANRPTGIAGLYFPLGDALTFAETTTVRGYAEGDGITGVRVATVPSNKRRVASGQCP